MTNLVQNLEQCWYTSPPCEVRSQLLMSAMMHTLSLQILAR
ncbi:MAG: hypothetical protein ACYTXT_31285 [Nostoc sp.]